MTDQRVLAVDPGREKCGVAVVDRQQGVLCRQVVDTTALVAAVAELLEKFGCRQVILGDQTASENVRQLLQPLQDRGLVNEIVFIDEHGSTAEARSRYWLEVPPTGWRRLLPRGLLSPPCAVDDFAAIILAERYFKK